MYFGPHTHKFKCIFCFDDNNKGWLQCEDCGREFSNRDSAILHRKQHNNERTHFCRDCGKGFFKASCLQRHMRSHTGEKPYNCAFCNRGFSQVTTLKNHKKVRATNPFVTQTSHSK